MLARVLQGFGGAGIMSVNGALIRFIFPRSALGRGIGYNVLIVSGSSAAGPSVAAAIMAVAPWPWLFAMQMPFALVAMVLGLRFLPYSPAGRTRLRPAQRRAERDHARPVHHRAGRHRPRPEHAPSSRCSWCVCVAVGVVFVRRQLRLRAPMLPVDLFRRPVFSLSVGTAICAHGAQMIAMITLPFYFQYVGGMSPVEIGALITPWPAALVVVGADRRPPGRPLPGRPARRRRPGGDDGRAAAGAVHAERRSPRCDIAWRLALCGLGFGFFQSPNNRLLIGSAPPDRAGAGSGMLSTSRLVGQTTGSALVALVFGVTHGSADAVATASHICFGIAAGAAGLAMVVSTLRLVQPRGGEESR